MCKRNNPVRGQVINFTPIGTTKKIKNELKLKTACFRLVFYLLSIAFLGKTIIKFSAVINGYHAYKVSMDNILSYRCIPEPGNSVDKAAVVLKETVTGDKIGHMPASPVKLNVAMLDIVQLDGILKYSGEWTCLNFSESLLNVQIIRIVEFIHQPHPTHLFV